MDDISFLSGLECILSNGKRKEYADISHYMELPICDVEVIAYAFTFFKESIVDAEEMLPYHALIISQVWQARCSWLSELEETDQRKNKKYKLSTHDQSLIFEAYGLSDGNVNRAVELTGKYKGTIVRYWNHFGLEIRQESKAKTKVNSEPELKEDEVSFEEISNDGNSNEGNGDTVKKNNHRRILHFSSNESSTHRRFYVDLDTGEVVRRKLRLSSVDRGRILLLYNTHSGNPYNASSCSEYHIDQVVREWDKLGFEFDYED